jgi:hypothetical protein
MKLLNFLRRRYGSLPEPVLSNRVADRIRFALVITSSGERSSRRCREPVAWGGVIYEPTEALGTLVRPTAFKAVERRFILSLVGSIPMRFRRPC